jgi:hypothetical protein
MTEAPWSTLDIRQALQSMYKRNLVFKRNLYLSDHIGTQDLDMGAYTIHHREDAYKHIIKKKDLSNRS